ncbi:ComF family protein [Tenacibaculum sp. MEBiC06402]|uniref:ComF family protein n=1 Tax=unclassified Tenacibaculum TaxID=2635139 RepID=UPI003B9B05CD
MRIFKDFLRVFFPNLCVGCSNELLYSETILCNFCSNDLPILKIDDYTDNIVTSSFYGRIPIEKSVSFLLFHKKNLVQKLIHELKYKNREDIGEYLGNSFVNSIQEGQFMRDIDYIIPVPIHSKKLKKRGYNQVMSFCESLSSEFNIPIQNEILVRLTNTKSQTSKTRLARAETIGGDFYLQNKSLLENKHILLVDDVITTGATIEACCKELLKTEKLKISVLSIAFTENT